MAIFITSSFECGRIPPLLMKVVGLRGRTNRIYGHLYIAVGRILETHRARESSKLPVGLTFVVLAPMAPHEIGPRDIED